MNAMHSYHRFRRMEAERIRLAWIHHKNYVDAERKYRREEYEAKKKALEEEKERKALEKIEAENAKYRVFTGKNGATIDAKVIAISPLIKKAKLKSREGNTFEIAMVNFSNQDVEYLKSWGIN